VNLNTARNAPFFAEVAWFIQPATVSNQICEAETALKALREAKDPDTKRKAAEALEKAVRKLREQEKPK
jgi:F0F1-type ATP synthase epsilon subunit